MAITAFLDLHLRPDAIGRASEVLASTLQQTRAFDGSLGLEVLRDVADPTHLTVVERWASLQHDDAYRAWRATPDGASRLGEVFSAPPTLIRYETHSSH